MALAGAHRTGKTTVAKAFSEEAEMPFIQTSLSALATDMGVKIGLDMPFEQRQQFQERALALFENEYQTKGDNGCFVTDRSPIDLAAYVMTAWHPNFVTPELTDWAFDYVNRCLEMVNRYFKTVIIIQPASFPFVQEAQKGENIDLYRESLNATMIGLALHDDCDATTIIMPRNLTDFAKRCDFVKAEYADDLKYYIAGLKANLPIQ